MPSRRREKARATRRSRKPRAKFQLKSKESLKHGLQRVIAAQLDLAIWYLSRDSKPLEEAAHETRKAMKRIRSILRLLGISHPKRFRQEDSRLRDVGRRLASLRDSQALVEVLDEMSGQQTTPDVKEGAIRLRDQLIERRRVAGENFRRRQEGQALVQKLRKIRASLKIRRFHRVTVTALRTGLAHIAAEGRAAYRSAYRTGHPELFHDWRKRAKNLDYCWHLLANRLPAFSGSMDESDEEARKELGDLLGRNHNATVLRETLSQMARTCREFADGPKPLLAAMSKAIDEYQWDLRTRAKRLGERGYDVRVGKT